MKPRYRTINRKCSWCGVEYIATRNLQKVCSLDCALEQSRKKAAAQAIRQAETKAKADLKQRKIDLKPRSKILQEAQAEVNKYVRTRDENLPCISCQRHHEGQYHAGHYRSVGSMPSLRFVTTQIWRQCSACNNHLSGNLIEYRKNLINKIGLERVEKLEGPQQFRSFDVPYLIRIKKLFAKRTRHLRRLRDHRA